LVFFTFAIVGCREPEGVDVRLEGKIVPVPLLEEVPICENGRSFHSKKWEVMEVRIVDGGEEYLRDGIWFEGEEEKVIDFLRMRSGDERRGVLRIWAGPEVKFKVLRKVIRKSAYAGIGTILFAVRERSGATQYQDLILNLPRAAPGDGTVPSNLRDIVIDKEGRFFHLAETGREDEMDDETLWEMLALLKSVSEMTDSAGPYCRLIVEPEAKYQRFIDFWKIVVEHDLQNELSFHDPREWRDPQKLPKGPLYHSKPMPPAKVKWRKRNGGE